jgi:hypothetical protein
MLFEETILITMAYIYSFLNWHISCGLRMACIKGRNMSPAWINKQKPRCVVTYLNPTLFVECLLMSQFEDVVSLWSCASLSAQKPHHYCHSRGVLLERKCHISSSWRHIFAVAKCCAMVFRVMQYKKSSFADYFFFPDCSGLKKNGNAVFLNVLWSAGLKIGRHFPENTDAKA